MKRTVFFIHAIAHFVLERRLNVILLQLTMGRGRSNTDLSSSLGLVKLVVFENGQTIIFFNYIHCFHEDNA